MKSVIVISFILLVRVIGAQSKKEQIEILTNRVDSLNGVLNLERNINSEKINTLNSKVYQINNELIVKSEELKLKDYQIKELQGKINDLTRLMEIKNDSISLLSEIIHSRGRSPIKLPFKYGQTKHVDDRDLSTFFYDKENRFYAITDSIDTKLNQGQDKVRMYFVTPLEEELQIQCPGEFGILIINNKNQLIYDYITDSKDWYNFFVSFNNLLILKKERPLLCLGISGCGSGASIMYFDIRMNNEVIEIKEAFSANYGGWGFTKLFPDRNLYIEFERINPESHWDGDTRYKLTFFNLTTNENNSIKETKFIYEHFGNIGEDGLIEEIRKKEPNLINY